MAFDQSRIDRIKQDPDSKFNKYLNREIQLDVLENEDLPVPYEHSDFITQFEYEAYSNYEFNLKKVSDIVKQKDPLKRLYYDEILENIKAVYPYGGNIVQLGRKYLIYMDEYANTEKPDWHTGYKTINGSDYPSHQKLIGYKDTMVEKLKNNSGILIFPQGYKAFSGDSFNQIRNGDILKSLKITDGVEALNKRLIFSRNRSLSDLYISTTLKEEIDLDSLISYSKVKDFFIPSNITKLPYMKDLYRNGINSIVIYDSSVVYEENGKSFFTGIQSSNNLKKLYVTKTETPDRETVDQAESLKNLGIEVENITELPYMKDLYRDGINSIVIYDSSDVYDENDKSFFTGIQSSNNLKKLYVIKTETPDRETVEQAEMLKAKGVEVENDKSFFTGIQSSNNLKKLYVIKTETPDRETVEQAESLKNLGVEVENVTEQEAFEIMGYDYDLYLKKKKDGIPEYSWGEVKPEQYNPSIVISKNSDPLMLEISTLEKNNDELLEKDIDTIKNSYESIIKGYEDAIEKLQTIEEYNLDTIDESGNILKYIEFLKGRINTKLKVLQYDNSPERIEELEKDKQNLQNQIDTLNADLDSKTKNISQLEVDKQGLQSQIDSLNQEIENLKAKASTDDEKYKKEIKNLEEEKKTLQDKIDAYTNVDKNLIIQDSLNIFKTFIGVHKDDIEEDEFYIFCLSTAYERLQNIDGIKLDSDDISRYFLVSEAQRVLTQSKEETLYEKGLKLTRHYATRGGKDE